MLESLLLFLAVAFVFVLVVGVLGYFALRWVFMRTAEKMVSIIDKSVGGVAAHAFTGLARYARAKGIPLEEANRLFGAHIDRLARIMDSAITLPILGRVGLDAVLDLIPVFGNFAGAAVSLTLIARTLAVWSAPIAGVADALERPRRRHSRRHSADRPARRHVVQGQRPQCGADARIPRFTSGPRIPRSGMLTP